MITQGISLATRTANQEISTSVYGHFVFPPSHTREGSETSPGCLILAFGSAEKSTWWKMRRRIERDTVNLLSHVMTRGLGREREVERSCGVAETWTTRTSLWARKVQRLKKKKNCSEHEFVFHNPEKPALKWNWWCHAVMWFLTRHYITLHSASGVRPRAECWETTHTRMISSPLTTVVVWLKKVVIRDSTVRLNSQIRLIFPEHYYSVEYGIISVVATHLHGLVC